MPLSLLIYVSDKGVSVAVETSRRAREGWAHIYNKRVRKHFQPDVGILVWVKVHPGRHRGPGRALGDRWRGPARIVKKIGPVSYLCRDVNEPYRERVSHLSSEGVCPWTWTAVYRWRYWWWASTPGRWRLWVWRALASRPFVCCSVRRILNGFVFILPVVFLSILSYEFVFLVLSFGYHIRFLRHKDVWELHAYLWMFIPFTCTNLFGILWQSWFGLSGW